MFWYHNSPLPQVAGRLYDYSLVPTAALYFSQNALAALHPQFDYLKNTISIYNDYRVPFNNYNISATVYNLSSDTVLTLDRYIDIPADGVVNDVLKIDFPSNISQVHFIKLILKDANKKIAAETFYWRSSDAYNGAWTLTGPAVSGFQEISNLPKLNLDFSTQLNIEKDKIIIDVEVPNPSNSISFFTRLKMIDELNKQIKPAFYSDNFFSLLPGEGKKVKIEIPVESVFGNNIYLILDGWNAKQISKKIQLYNNFMK